MPVTSVLTPAEPNTDESRADKAPPGCYKLFFFFPPPEQLFSSEDFLQCETGSAAAWETGGGEGAVLLPLPFFPPHERGAEALSS